MAEAAETADAARDRAATVDALKEQVKDLTATLESHGHIFALIRAAGMLPQDDGGPGAVTRPTQHSIRPASAAAPQVNGGEKRVDASAHGVYGGAPSDPLGGHR